MTILKNSRFYSLAAAALMSLAAMAQSDGQKTVTVTGSIQSDILIPEEDAKIGTDKYSEWGLTNTYADVNVMSKYDENEYLDAGLRLEYLDHPLPGFDKKFKGWGVGNAYVRFHMKRVELTAGNFYEQFGSGFILRTYEERSLGVDNSLLGGRVTVTPVDGVTIKALTGKQRNYWTYNDALISGADVEIGLENWIRPFRDNGTYLTLGASFVNKNEKDEVIQLNDNPLYRLNLPRNVNAFDVRARFQKGGLNVLAEYAQKSQDPVYDKLYPYIYRKGYVAMLSGSYSQRGLSLLLQAKRSDNMAFKSRRRLDEGALTSSFINHLPAFTLDHTYALAALYPYATNANGEWAYQAELGYNFKKRTVLGGKYGTKVKLNYSHVHGINRTDRPGTMTAPGGYGTDGYGSAFWKWGDGMYYQDLDVQVEKKLTKSFKLNLMYMNQFYNQTVVEGHGGMIHSDIFVAEGKYQFNRKFTLRGEAQYLTTDHESGDWAFGLLELSILPRFMVTISDMYGRPYVGSEYQSREHYYSGYVTYAHGGHRLQLGYGRTRAGYNCSGGVCRYVPASKGMTVSYNYNF